MVVNSEESRNGYEERDCDLYLGLVIIRRHFYWFSILREYKGKFIGIVSVIEKNEGREEENQGREKSVRE